MKQLLLMAVVVGPLLAQIPGNPRFHRGDDPRWADPAFDDRSWDRVADRYALTAEELAVNRQWLRVDVEVPAGPSELVVTRCACEFFLNGVRLGATGNLDAPLPDFNHVRMNIPVPPEIPAGPAVLAIREYSPPGQDAAYPAALRTRRVQLVPAARVAATLLSLQRAADSQVVPAIILLMVLTMTLTTVGLRRWDGVAALLSLYVVLQVFIMVLVSGVTMDRSSWVVNWIAAIPNAPIVLGAMALACRLSPPRVLVAAYLLVHVLPRAIWVTDLLRADPAPWTPVLSWIYVAQLVLAILIGLGIALIGWRPPGSPRLMLAAGVLVLCMNLLGRFAIGDGGLRLMGIYYSWDRCANVAFAVAAASWVIRQERARRSEELRLKNELEAAKTVQTLLLGQAVPEGIDAVYLPAAEVGGDFWHYSEGLLVVGDVSGKGLKAAMVVSLITGMLDRRHSTSPAAVLAELNRALHARLDGGFVTCCVLRIDGEGHAVVASAGHPAPYVDGAELTLPAGLPLGMVPEAEYEETNLGFQRQLTLVSDGVVEAENAQRELFGFDRTRAISTQSAQEIAEAAKQWGQNDDITVVTVRRTAA